MALIEGGAEAGALRLKGFTVIFNSETRMVAQPYNRVHALPQECGGLPTYRALVTERLHIAPALGKIAEWREESNSQGCSQQH